jgi:hypothetical protein
MKVRMNHAVDLGQVPGKLGEMVSEIKKEVEEAQAEAVQAEAIVYLSSDSVLKYRLLGTSLNNLKRVLADTEQSIDDMISILEGYVGLLEPKPATPVPPEAPVVADAPVKNSAGEPNAD